MVVVLLVFLGAFSTFAIPGVTSKFRWVGDTQVTREDLIDGSYAALALLGGVVGTANPEENSLETVVFRVASGGKSIRAVDISVDGATVSYLDENRVFNVPAGQWTSVWRRGHGPLLDQGEIVEITVVLRDLFPPVGNNTDFSIRLHPIDGEVLMIRRSTLSKLAGFIELET